MGHAWANNLTTEQATFIFGFPILWVFIIYVFLNFILDRFILKIKEGTEYAKIVDEERGTKTPAAKATSYGTSEMSTELGSFRSMNASTVDPNLSTVPTEGKFEAPEDPSPPSSPEIKSCSCFQDSCEKCRVNQVIESGAVAGNYEKSWKDTFDLVFLMLMVATAAVLIIITGILHPNYFLEWDFWAHEILKFVTMVGVSCIGGLLCRCFCAVDDKGYIITNKGSWFKVNYTRKLQHFAAYMIPLVLQSKFHNTLSLAWGDFFTLLAFFVLIKPIREYSTFFMLQFNALDRPEDRPYTLDWIVLGNLGPGFLIIIFFKWLFALEGNASLVTIIVYITGIGDGLAEPVGIYFGKHKYSAMSCVEGRSYQRSWEGSACVFMSGVFFPAMQYSSFDSFNQVAAAMILLPPIMTYLEATAPHTMDSPVLMAGSGAILLVVLYVF